MTRIIGPAKEFYRLRIVTLDSYDELELEWRSDVLYRKQDLMDAVDTGALFVVEAVGLLDESVVALTEPIDSRKDIAAVFDRALEDLSEMTVSDFKLKYLPK